MQFDSGNVITVPVGEPALTALSDAVAQAQAGDPFARVVIIAAHPDVARAVRHWLGARGAINVTVQTGERLARELARPTLKPLTRLHESQAVRRVADEWLQSGCLQLSAAGRRRLYAELTVAFRERERRPELAGDHPDLPGLYERFQSLLKSREYYTRYALPHLAANALESGRPAGTEPAVIYYLPRHPDAGELRLAHTLSERGKCQVIIGLTGDGDADESASANPLAPAVAAGALSIVVAPDPTEEARAVVRRIVAMADDVPFHRIAVVHRQETPYASLLRQELDFAGIPYSGVPRRPLADTNAGRFLLGLLALTAGDDAGIDREQLISWMTATPVLHRHRLVPATRWANLARAARANGPAARWETRLEAHLAKQQRRFQEWSGDAVAAGDSRLVREKRAADELLEFVKTLEQRLRRLHNPDAEPWESAANQLQSLLNDCHRRTDGDEDDYKRIVELVNDLAGLADWNAAYSLDVLREAVADGLQSPVSNRGQLVGSGVYVGPPAGVVGADYRMLYVLGLVEGQFPPALRNSLWSDTTAAAQIQSAQERYEFLGAIASAGQTILSCPAAGADRRAVYPSRWLIETANLLHRQAGAAGRLTYDNLTADAGAKAWLTVIPSRETGLRQLAAGAGVQPADVSDYNLMHLSAHPRRELASHPALQPADWPARALAARRARWGATLTEWDGRVGDAAPRVSGVGAHDSPVSASALETWAACPYRYFLGRVLGLERLPEPESEAMSALDRGALVHKILERFVNEDQRTAAELRALAEAEFAVAESQGITGYPLLWELDQDAIHAGLERLLADDAKRFGDAALLASYAEVNFGPGSAIGAVSVAVDGLGEVWFRGKIDRVDALADAVRVRDFKTGSPDRYRVKARSGKADDSPANGRALQLPVYVAAAQAMYPDQPVAASYCFPLHDQYTHDVAPYHDTDAERQQFHHALTAIVGAARQGVFPATPDADAGERGNCDFCDFKRLCPVRRRQLWENKRDPDLRPLHMLRDSLLAEDDDDSQNG